MSEDSVTYLKITLVVVSVTFYFLRASLLALFLVLLLSRLLILPEHGTVFHRHLLVSAMFEKENAKGKWNDR
jgi:hypothetical protein